MSPFKLGRVGRKYRDEDQTLGQGSPDAALRSRLVPLDSVDGSYDTLLERIGDARFALLGESSHGTDEFYRARAAICRRLIEEKGFRAIAVEADWPDAARVDRYVRCIESVGRDKDGSAEEALGSFERFPTWMWRNEAMRDFVEWLAAWNREQPLDRRVGFYGIDLYSLHRSMQAVLDYLSREDPDAAARAKRRYGCFDHFGEDPQVYGQLAAYGVSAPCESAATQQLVDLLQSRLPDDDRRYSAEQNARVVRNAEQYYRSMFRGRASSWNLRDTHMMETLNELVAHLEKDGEPAKVAVWAHNSHLGDARATAMARGGELNLGQLVREQYGDEAFLLGFTTSEGSVTAADEWDAPPRKMRVRPPLEGSCERVFRETGVPNFFLPLRREVPPEEIAGNLIQRAIGVIYRPETERMSHYFETRLAGQFDAVIHFDETHAVVPLDVGPWHASDDAPDTFPSGL
jgi:erythromycin esterase-like protein